MPSHAASLSLILCAKSADSGGGWIVDLGASVGFAALDFAVHFPKARITLFEPHPVHCQLIRQHIRMNSLESRLHLVEAGAASLSRKAYLSDEDVCSTVSDTQSGFPIDLVDLFEFVGDAPIDILKMDIEGGEKELLNDPRFANLKVRYLVMEWHENFGGDRQWCLDRLHAMGYRTAIRFDRGPYGTLAATRDPDLILPPRLPDSPDE